MIRKFKKIRRWRFNPPSLRLRRARKRKSILRIRFFWDFILFLVLGLSVFHFLFLSEIFKVKEIKIAGPSNIPYFELKKIINKNLEKKFLHFFLADSLFLVNTQEIEKEILRNYPEIKTASLKKKFPKTLLLEIKKREAVGLVCFFPDTCFLADNQGIIFKTVRDPVSDKLVKIFYEKKEIGKIGENVIPEDTLNKIWQINNSLEEKLDTKIEKFILKDNRLDVKTAEGWEIYFDLSGDINLALAKLRLLLEKEISPEERKNLEYIDLRFSRVYYK